MYELEQVWKVSEEGFYALRGGTNWASIEGHASEWLEVAKALRDRGRAHFARVAVGEWRPGMGSTLWSPRNACGPNDHVELTHDESLRLSENIVRMLWEHDEECVRGRFNFDPIHLGA